MKLYLLRHGQSTNNLLMEQASSNAEFDPDPHLTELGRKQALMAAEFLRLYWLFKTDQLKENDHSACVIYSSLMIRSVETGLIISEKLQLPLIGFEELHERGGIYQIDSISGEIYGLPGRSKDYFKTNYPELRLPKAMESDGWWNRPFEKFGKSIFRAENVVSRLISDHSASKDNVLLVTHEGFYNDILSVIFRLPRSTNLEFLLDNAGISRIDFLPERIICVFLHKTEYLNSSK
jgi:2,3-bisphosphoglycerate-dependent phosphoglycerate mutase